MSLSSFFTGAPAKFKLTFADADTRQTVTTKVNDKDVEQYLFGAVDNVCGTVCATVSCHPSNAALSQCRAHRFVHNLRCLTVRPSAASQVDIEVIGGKKMEHMGIKIELIGHIGAPCCHPAPPPSDSARTTVRGWRRSA